MKYKYKLHPGAYALGENEKFYGDMEAKGWRLVKRGARYSKFRPTEPSEARYRVEVARSSPLDGGGLPEAQLAVFEDCGWEYVTGRGSFHYFRAPKGSGAPEFYQDPRQQAETLKGVRRSLLWGLALCAVLAALLAPAVIALSGGTHALLASVQRAWLTAPGLPLFWCLMLFSGLSVDLIDTWQIVRTYRSLKKGIPLDHAPKGRGLVRRVLDHGLRILAYLCLLTVAVQLVTMQRGELPSAADGPYIVLRDAGRTEERGAFLGRTSQREHTRTFFAEYWDIQEYLGSPDWPAVSLYQEVYRLSPWLDPMDWVGGLTGEQTFEKDIDAYVPVEIDGLDAAWVSENGMEAVAVKGQLMAFVNYLDGSRSPQRLTEILRALSARWADPG